MNNDSPVTISKISPNFEQHVRVHPLFPNVIRLAKRRLYLHLEVVCWYDLDFMTTPGNVDFWVKTCSEICERSVIRYPSTRRVRFSPAWRAIWAVVGVAGT